jgi:hypothetical protein
MNIEKLSTSRRCWIAATAIAVAGLAWFMARDDGPRYGGRYDVIADLIDDNLHLGRHFTWAITAETIKAVRPHVGAADLAVLERMLADERGAVSVAAGSLLVMLGDGGEAVLRRAAASDNLSARMHANDALIHLEACRDATVTNLDRELCPPG